MQPSDLNKLNVVHVAGTKGKGTVCAYTDAILRACARRGRLLPPGTSVGLMTSPHLVAVRERIRIDAVPIPERLFARYFFELWDRARQRSGGDKGEVPRYARFLTVLGFHVFLREGVGLAVVETGLGGEYDATNIVPRPVATGITSLGLDHVEVLGGTLAEIAWHKAGIIKSSAPALSVPQPHEAATVLESRARQAGQEVRWVGIDPRLDRVKITPDAEFQRLNASLAVALAEQVVHRAGQPSEEPGPGAALPDEFVEGLEGTVLRGRCQVLKQGNVAWHLDGAHTAESITVASRWFRGVTRNRWASFIQVRQDPCLHANPTSTDLARES